MALQILLTVVCLITLTFFTIKGIKEVKEYLKLRDLQKDIEYLHEKMDDLGRQKSALSQEEYKFELHALIDDIIFLNDKNKGQIFMMEPELSILVMKYKSPVGRDT